MRLFPKPVVQWKVPREFGAHVRAREGPIPFWMRPLALLLVGMFWIPVVYLSNYIWRQNPQVSPERWWWKGPVDVGGVLLLGLLCTYVVPWIHSLERNEVKVFTRQLVYTSGGKPTALKWPSIRGYFWLEHERFLVLVLVVSNGARERRVYLGAPPGGEVRPPVGAALAKAGVHRWCPDENPFAAARPAETRAL